MKLMLEVGTVDLDARTVDHASGRTRLSSTEARLLRYLASRPNETISRDELYEKVWQYRPGLQTRTLDLAMFRLRKKVERNPREPAHLLTAYGSGYTFTPLGGPADTSEVSLDTPQTAFGHETTTFVGREAERQALTELLGPVSRCVTVLGPPGIGKTRLARQWTLERLRAESYDSAVSCELAEGQTDDDVLRMVAAALGVSVRDGDGGSESIADRLADAMAERGRLLVLLDSVERLVEVVGAQVARWRRLAPQVHFLVTSHVPLGLDWEQRFPLDPLPLPSSVDGMDDNPCVRLFVDRARQVQPGFDPDTTQAAALVELITRLDGLPLAIELAAGRSHLLAPDDLLDRLDQRFRLLRRSQGYGAGRHGTLQAALDWAWEMLQPWEQAALAQCSVFRGGFDWAAVEAVIRLDDVRDAPWSIDVVADLAERSLVMVRESPGGGARLTLLESVAAYASGRLATRGEAFVADTHARHAAHYVAMVRPGQHGSRDQARFLTREFDNLDIAVERSLAHGWPEQAIALAVASLKRTRMSGPYTRGIALGVRVLTQLADSPHRAPLLEMTGLLERVSGRLPEARAHFEQALALRQQLQDRSGEAVVRGNLAQLDDQLGELDRAAARYEAALRLAREVGDTRLEGTVLAALGDLAAKQGRHEEALTTYYRHALDIARAHDNVLGECVLLCNIGIVLVRTEQLDLAEARLGEALALARELGAVESQGIALQGLGRVHLHRGQLDEARRIMARAEALFEQVNSPRRIAILWCERGELELQAENHQAAMQALDEAERRSGSLAAGAGWMLTDALERLRQRLAVGTPKPP